ncbi:MAG: Bacterial non-heme ferritin [Phycisphaerae bacterium]|nr:Bacterial non-heme ferritin [Phycisphaerae bacterium]
MLDPKMEKQLNQQVAEEMYSSNLYLDMAMHYANVGLDGFAHWLRVQATEERDHALKITDYISQQGSRAVIGALAEPKAKYDSNKVIFEQVLHHEQHISKCIHQLVDLAISLKDHATQAFLQWFVTEQVEEEEQAGKILNLLKIAGEHGPGLISMDRYLASRAAE